MQPRPKLVRLIIVATAIIIIVTIIVVVLLEIPTAKGVEVGFSSKWPWEAKELHLQNQILRIPADPNIVRFWNIIIIVVIIMIIINIVIIIIIVCSFVPPSNCLHQFIFPKLFFEVI